MTLVVTWYHCGFHEDHEIEDLVSRPGDQFHSLAVSVSVRTFDRLLGQ